MSLTAYIQVLHEGSQGRNGVGSDGRKGPRSAGGCAIGVEAGKDSGKNADTRALQPETVPVKQHALVVTAVPMTHLT